MMLNAWISPGTPVPSDELPMLNQEIIDFFERAYFGRSGQHPDMARARPGDLRDLSGLPPALVVTAGFDTLREQGREFAHALKAAGNDVRLLDFPTATHGFLSMQDVSPLVVRAWDEIAEVVRRRL